MRLGRMAKEAGTRRWGVPITWTCGAWGTSRLSPDCPLKRQNGRNVPGKLAILYVRLDGFVPASTSKSPPCPSKERRDKDGTPASAGERLGQSPVFPESVHLP